MTCQGGAEPLDWSSLPREETDCILCGSSSRVLLSIQMTWPVVRCDDCGLVYLAQRPAEEAMTLMYNRSYYEDGDVGYSGYEELFKRYNDKYMQIFNRRHRDLIHRTKGRRLLEVGCAHGFLLDYLREHGWTVTGVEISPLSSAYARDRFHLNVITGDIESAGLENGSFDVILLLDVLEHLHRPFDALSCLKDLLAPGGVLVVQCPWELYHWEEVAEALLRGMKPGTIEPDAVPAHLYFFGPRTLEAVLGKAGFRIIGRQSGNYGAIRRLVDPPRIDSGNLLSIPLRFIYFRLGLQRIMYSVARLLGLGNGMIRYASPKGNGNIQ